MQTKNIVIIASLTVVSLMISLFWVVAPALMKDKIVGVFTYASADRQCFNYYKNQEKYFNDPDSAYIESSHILTKEHDETELTKYSEAILAYKSIVQVKVFALNRMGGYVSDDIICPLAADRRFDESVTRLYLVDVTLEEMNLRSEEKRKEFCTKIVKYPKDDNSEYVRKRCPEYF
ncbi:MAG: hypothetical protein Q8L15_02295 [Methylobacter sp.]|nr:hypothetical protein [Methylobacter sp.]